MERLTSMASPIYAVVAHSERVVNRNRTTSATPKITIIDSQDKPRSVRVNNKLTKAVGNKDNQDNEGKSLGSMIGKVLGVRRKKNNQKKTKVVDDNDNDDNDDNNDNNDNNDEDSDDDNISVASTTVVEKTFKKNGRHINIGKQTVIEQPDYDIPENLFNGSTKSMSTMSTKPSTKISVIEPVKTYDSFASYYGYLTSLKFMNKDQITDYLVLIGLTFSLNQPINDDKTIKSKQKIATKAIKLASGIKPIKTSDLMSFKDLPNRHTRQFCETIFIEYDTDKSITINTPVDYTERDFSMSFYNSLFIQLNKSNQINQTNIKKVYSDFYQQLINNTLFESVIHFFNTNIGFYPTTEYEVAEFLKILIGRCADIVYENTKGKLDDKDKFTRIGKFPQNECFIALSAMGFEIVLYIDLDKYKCIRIYKPVNYNKKLLVLNFHLNKDGIFSYTS